MAPWPRGPVSGHVSVCSLDALKPKKRVSGVIFLDILLELKSRVLKPANFNLQLAIVAFENSLCELCHGKMLTNCNKFLSVYLCLNLTIKSRLVEGVLD